MRYLCGVLVCLIGWWGSASAQTVTITVRSSQTLPSEDTVYLIVPTGQDYPAGSYPMRNLSAKRWRIKLTDVAKGTLKFHLSRNDLGTPSYDKFEIDQPNKIQLLYTAAQQ